MTTQYLFPPFPTRPPPFNVPSKVWQFFDALQMNLSLSTILLIGAVCQSALAILLPFSYALLPAVVILLYRAIDTTLISLHLKGNPYLKGAIMKKVTAQILQPSSSLSGSGVNEKADNMPSKIAILHLGAKSNHPLGIFAPDFDVLGNWLEKMTAELEGDLTQDNGFLGQTAWSRRDANGANEIITVSYWRTIEDIHAFAHGPTHRRAWAWWDETVARHAHLGIMHEVFEADAGMWESVYVNFQPTGLGAATTFLRDRRKPDGNLEPGTVADKWLSPLMDAGRGKFRSMKGRRGVLGTATAHGDKEIVEKRTW